MLRKLTDGCRTSLTAVSGIKTEAARDAQLLLSNMALPIRELIIMPPPVEKGALSVTFVRPSVRRVHSE